MSTSTTSIDNKSTLDNKDKVKKNAIFMMCIMNDVYVLGACISGYCHRKMLESARLKDTVDLVIMCDADIYDKYHKLLSCDIFFDRVEKIDLRIFKDSTSYEYCKLKYSSWIGASLNKWQIMKYDEYDKIMFVDIALLPAKLSFYDLFNYNLPVMLMRKENDALNDPKDLECKDGLKIDNARDKNITYDEYLKNDIKYGTIHGNLLVLKPDKTMYNDYVKMTDELYKDGIYSIYKSGPDETSLFYFFMSKEINIFSICHENADIPWDEHILIDIAKGYEFSSCYKPWIKPKVLCWPEEILWRDIYDIIVKKLLRFESGSKCKEQSLLLLSLFKKTMLNTYNVYMSSDKYTQKRNFNNKFIQKYENEFNKLKDITNQDDLFNALMKIDTKIYIRFYGPLKTDKLISVL